MASVESYEFWGIDEKKRAGKEIIGDCPFCLKPDHFYLNSEKLLWDCKRCGKSGGWAAFLDELSSVAEAAMTDGTRHSLSVSRGLPLSAFEGRRIGYLGQNTFSVPVMATDGAVMNLKRWKVGGKLIGTKDVESMLYGLEEIRPTGPVYVAEGEWDAVAMSYMLRKAGVDATVVGVPGAGNFSPGWLGVFQDRDVFLAYDADEAGIKGMDSAEAKLEGIARSVSRIHWPGGTPEGYDVRDFVAQAVRAKTTKDSWPVLQSYFTSSSESTPVVAAGTPIGFEEVAKAYTKWLSLPSLDVLRVIFGACFANRLDGDPVWLFLVGAPGSGKSEILMSLSGHDSIVAKSTLTSASLVSGWQMGGADHSLIPKLDGKTLVVKDFTALISSAPQERDAVFGLLRDAYDGSIEKSFGTGVRAYKSHFGVIAGTTNVINAFAAEHVSLGERFLKYCIPPGKEEDKIRVAIANINRESGMREEILQAAARFLCSAPAQPTLSVRFVDRVVALARFCSVLRGAVARERYSGVVSYTPTTETGTRPAKQLAKFGMGLAMVEGRTEVGDQEYEIIKDVALGSCPDRVALVVKALHSKGCSDEELSKVTRLPVVTIKSVTQDLFLLGSLKKIGMGKVSYWELGEDMKDYILRSEIYPKAPVVEVTNAEVPF